jgi:hypothetical protein
MPATSCLYIRTCLLHLITQVVQLLPHLLLLCRRLSKAAVLLCCQRLQLLDLTLQLLLLHPAAGQLCKHTNNCSMGTPQQRSSLPYI